MPDTGSSLRVVTMGSTAGLLLALMVVAVPEPVQALSGEETLEFHKEFVITYNNVSGSDVIWWDWEVTGKVVDMTFLIILTDPELSVKEEQGASLTIHEEFSSKSRGQIKLRDGFHTATVRWSCHALRFVTFRYHVMLNPPDLAMYYLLAAVVLLAPAVVIGAYLARERSLKPKRDDRKATGEPHSAHLR